MPQICSYFSINFHSIWTKICIRTPDEVPSNITSTCESLRATGSEIWALEKKFFEKTPFFDPKNVNKSTKKIFRAKRHKGLVLRIVIGSRMQNFSQIVRRVLEIPIFFSSCLSWKTKKHGSASGTLPNRATSPNVRKTPAPSGYRVRIYLAICRRRACLGMPTDGGRWCKDGALTLVMRML